MGEGVDRLRRDLWLLDAREDSAAAEAYRRACAHMFAVTLLVPDGAFHNRLEGYNFGNGLLGRCTGVPQRFERTRAHVAGDPADTVQLILDLTETQWSGDYDGRPAERSMGTIHVVDMTRPFRFETQAFETLNLVLPRGALGSAADLDLHGVVLSEEDALPLLLASHLRRLWDTVGGLGHAEARAAMEATIALARAAIAAGVSETRAHRRAPRESLLSASRKLIDENLVDPALSPELIWTRLGISRSVLYQMFEPLGGVRRYILARRLGHAFDAILADREEARTLGQIGYSLGFRSDAHFSRAFRAHFGISPGRLRELGPRARSEGITVIGEPDNVWTWLRGL